MAIFEQLEYLPISPSKIPEIASHLQSVYSIDAPVQVKYGEDGRCEVEIIAKQIFNFSICVNVSMTPHAGDHLKVNVYNPNLIGTILCGILVLIIPMRWYQIVPYFSVLFGQASFDNKVMSEIKRYLNLHGDAPSADHQAQKQFCVYCGAENFASAAVCSKCGKVIGDAPEPIPEPAPQPVPQPVPQPAPQPTPQPAPQPTPRPTPSPKKQGGSLVMEIDKVSVFGDSVLLLGVCQSVVAVGDMVKVESSDGNLVVVEQVHAVQSYSIPVPKSKPGCQTVLELKGYSACMIKDGTVYLR